MSRPRKKDRHLPPCVYPKHGRYWYVKKGKWTDLGSTLTEALKKYAEGYERPPETGAMAKLIDAAFDSMKPALAAATIAQYKLAATQLKASLVEFEPRQVQPRHLAELKVGYTDKPNMGNRILSFARQVFDYALEHQLIDSNPAVGIKRHPEKKRTRLISIEEYQRIYGKAGPRLQIIMDLKIRCGQRIRAILRIRIADLTDEGIAFGAHKTKAKRIVPWTDELREIVARAKGLHKVRTLTLLQNRKRKPPDYSTVRLQWEKACAAAGVQDAHLHDLRAVAATWAKKQGKNPTTLLGHTSPAQTQRYLRDREEPLAEGPSFRRLLDAAAKNS